MRLSVVAVGFLGLTGCGDDKVSPDAKPVDATPDAATALSFADNEGGEIRLEWIEQYSPTAMATQTTARATAYFYKSQTPGRHDLPAFPGCFDMRPKDKWPLAQGTIVPLDVGGVTIDSKTGQDLVMVRDQSTPATLDPFSRPHELWWKKTSNLPANDGDTFLPPNETYDVKFAGSAEWPAQTIKDIAFMPARWTNLNPPVNATTQLVAGQPLTLTFTPAPSSNLPEGYRVNTTVAFQATSGFAGPIVLCQEEGSDGSITVPANLVDILRSYGGGRYVRQQLTHALFELTDGDPKPPGERKRVDVLTIYCYNTAWAPAP